MSTALRIAYLTAGTVGAGHLVRGLALHSALVRRGARGTFLLASPRLDLPGLDLPGLDVPGLAALDEREGPIRLVSHAITVDSRRVARREDALASDAARALRAFEPDLVLIDLFWVPFLHLVRAAGAPAWLLLRSCPPRWLVGPPEVPFDGRAFARVLWTEPCADGAIEGAERVEPIVYTPGDASSTVTTDLRARLRVTDPRPLALVAQGGKAGEIDALERLARERFASTHVVVRADLRAADAPFPLAPWLPQADAIVGGGGYNLVWELCWQGLLERSVLVPFARSIDDQAARLAVARTHRMGHNGADVLAADITAGIDGISARARS